MSPAILMYHEVTHTPERQKTVKTIDPEYSLPSYKFERQMDWLRSNGYEDISLDEIVKAKADQRKTCSITFDDGYIGNYTSAFPILKKYGYTGVIFLAAQYIASSEKWMNWDQIRELVDHGFSIQSHTLTHPSLSELDDEAIYYELAESKRIIEKEIDREVKYLSLPYGSGEKRVLALAAKAGYAAVLTSSLFKNKTGRQPVTLGRIAIKDSYSPQFFARLIGREKKLINRLQFEQAVKNMIKKTIGINRYRFIYRFAKSVQIEQESSNGLQQREIRDEAGYFL